MNQNPTIVLSPMPEEQFAAYLESSVIAYAEDNVESGRWPREGALERSRADFRHSLPQGLATPDHHVCEILDEATSRAVGVLWFAVVEKQGIRSAFVYDVMIHPAHRRKGYAKAAFGELEAMVRTMGLTTIGLHVFAHNSGAQALYKSLGYNVTGMNMKKDLR